MGKSCCIKGGHNRQNREQDWHCFLIPNVAINKGKEMEELTSRRRREWLAQLKLKGLTFMHREERRGASMESPRLGG